MKQISFVVCGCGCRGTWVSTNVIAQLPEVRIVAVCDPYEDKAQHLADLLEQKGHARPQVFTEHERMMDTVACDAVFDATSWEAHVPVAVYAMQHGIAVAMEVGGAHSEQECCELVDVQRQTGTPFMMMENCCYGKEELLATSLARAGRFGEIVYCQGAYAHDLREEIAYGEKNRHYRLKHYSTRNGENYPTHELGPIARLLNITRGNRMCRLSAFASKARGLHDYIQGRDDLAHMKDTIFPQGDIVETLITCENGELIRLRLDTTLPRYYSREFTVRGTHGMYNQDANFVHIEGDGMKEDFSTVKTLKDNLDNGANYEAYLPRIWRDVDPEVLEKGHGGMDWFVFDAFVDALREGRPMPIDVYDATAWMCITYLSELSIKNGNMPVDIPDFTDGAWQTRTPTDLVTFPVVD